MAPRTRNRGRARLLAAGPVNTTGLPSLAIETLHEIISYYVAVPRNAAPKVCPILSCVYLERRNALRALSCTCKRLRSIFLAQAWESIEACASSRIPEDYELKGRGWGSRFEKREKEIRRELAIDLVSQLETVTERNPAFAQHIRCVTISLTTWCAENVGPELYRALVLLPNLETLQILRYPDYCSTNSPFAASYEVTLPSVRTLRIPVAMYSLLHQCPNVQRLTLDEWSPHVMALKTPKLLALDCPPVSATSIPEILERKPYLHEIPTIRTNYLTPDRLKTLKGMKSLQSINLDNFYVPTLDRNDRPINPRALVDAAKEVLRSTCWIAGKTKYVTLRTSNDKTQNKVFKRWVVEQEPRSVVEGKSRGRAAPPPRWRTSSPPSARGVSPSGFADGEDVPDPAMEHTDPERRTDNLFSANLAEMNESSDELRQFNMLQGLAQMGQAHAAWA
ncbi:hypothetical protein C8J57DRAFT_1202012 [Mycena rebaudengoi]|nr:hypothetical protein C8J57DRAFT_1202012 [Mycena rebaudengoi]